MGNLPFERTRYNPVQDVTGEEAERNKQQMNTADAARERTQAVPGQGSAGDDDDAQARRVDGLGLGGSVAAHACSSGWVLWARASSSSSAPMMWPMRSRLVARYWWLLAPTPTSR